MPFERAEQVLSFWFGEVGADGLAAEATSARWWRKDPVFDAEILERFGEDHRRIGAGEQEDWLSTPRGRLGYVIVLDQFSRNMFRGTAGMFNSDERALTAVLSGLEEGVDRELPGDLRIFFYMPLMHSEELAMQDRCVQLFTIFRDESEGALRKRLGSNVDFAKQHRDIVARWGRFPHRNEILGRPSTREELEFLKEPGSSF